MTIAGRAPWPVLVALLVLLLAFGLRVNAATRRGLWADEIFSLAMATGHSLEHPAAEADSTLGDFVQPEDAQSPAAFRRYAEHERLPAGPWRVIRAVRMSDTSPPLYYLVLNWWTRLLGTSDAALRGLSVLWAALSLPLLWLVGRELGGPRAGWFACLLFAGSPVGLYYSVEGRMYAMLWCLVLALAWLSLRLSQDGRPLFAALWVMTGVAGLLTHYFFAFVWLASVAWLWIDRPPARRRAVGAACATVLAVLPWYVEVPASLGRWRVSGDWLTGELGGPSALGRPLALAGGLLASRTDLGGWRWADRAATAILILLVLELARRGSGRVLASRPALLLWGMLAAACTGPLVFDLLRHTTTSTIPRYVLPGLPAAIVLVALALHALPDRGAATVALAALLLAWLPGTWRAATAPAPRPGQPYPALVARLEAWARPGDVVLVRSIPSGVIGVARYLGRDVPLASWVQQLGTRDVPGDLRRLLGGRRRVAVATIHALGAEDVVGPWLRSHARVLGRDTFRGSSAEVVYFAPVAGDSLFPPAGAAHRWE